jgi:hypothetical protein
MELDMEFLLDMEIIFMLDINQLLVAVSEPWKIMTGHDCWGHWITQQVIQMQGSLWMS